MKRNIVSLFVFVALISLACQTTGLGVTPTPTITATSQPTETPTKRPTNTPLPTETQAPTQTPAPFGSTVRYKTLEITVVNFITSGKFYPGGWAEMRPIHDTDQFLEVGVFVRNTGPVIKIQWKYIGIVEENGDAWYPAFANFRKVEVGEKINPITQIVIKDKELKGYDYVEFDSEIYMRLVFLVKKNPGGDILFNIENSPYISFDLE